MVLKQDLVLRGYDSNEIEITEGCFIATVIFLYYSGGSSIVKGQAYTFLDSY